MKTLPVFAERLNELMIENNLDTTALIDIINVNRTSINCYLSGAKTPSIKVLIRIADYFNCSTDYLLGLKDDSFNKSYKPCPPFGERLKLLLQESKYSVYKFSRKAKIAESSIFDWIHDVHLPSVHNLIILAEKLDCSVDFLLGRGD